MKPSAVVAPRLLRAYTVDFTPNGVVPSSSRARQALHDGKPRLQLPPAPPPAQPPAATPRQPLPGWSQSFWRWRMEPQCLGRYSVDKLLLLQAYQDGTSLTRSGMVIALTALPVLGLAAVMVAFRPQAASFSAWPPPVAAIAWPGLAYTLLGIGAILPFRQALRLTETSYSCLRVGAVALCTSIGSQGANLLLLRLQIVRPAIRWSFIVLIPWLVFVLLSHSVLMRKLLTRKWRRVKRYLVVLTLQWLTIALSIGVSLLLAVLSAQQSSAMLPLCIAWFLVSPLVKAALRRCSWDPARRLLDLSTEISVCIIEMLWSVLNVAWLSRTVSAQSLSLRAVVLLLLVLAAAETLDAVVVVSTFSRRAFIVDGATALATAISIVRSALFPAATTTGTTPSPTAGRTRRPTIDRQSRESFSMSSPDRVLPAVSRSSISRLSLPSLAKVAVGLGARQSSDRYQRRQPSRRSTQHFLRCANSVFLPAADYEEKGANMRRLLDLSRYTVSAVTDSTAQESAQSPTARRVMLDGITIARREQARVLEQTLQLLFVAEALTLSTFLQALVPGVLALLALERALIEKDGVDVRVAVCACVVLIARALVTLAALGAVMSREYGLSMPRLLAFVLETYSKTVQGKLLTVVITLLVMTPRNTLHLSSRTEPVDL
ncbi:hypothetical protein P43SY_002914 [Pythium insidiosum]|uniref:Transmembrane protein n=1 Tax=Pythium insidiosum TaxID=114742 RepID=A0AAD5MC30_PYTIN|nr:hypothetical protein P43SY_002914 [Pythium insidiosum]